MNAPKGSEADRQPAPEGEPEDGREPEVVEPHPLPAPSRWDAPANASAPQRAAASEPDEGALSGALRILLLVAVASGALYAGLRAIRQDDAEPPGTVRAPRVVETRSVPVEPGPRPRPLRIEGFKALRDLKLGGTRSRLVRWVPEPPAAVCDSLHEAGWTAQAWGESPLGDMSECLAERSYGDGNGATGFAVLRGRETLSEIRIKLNFEDGEARKVAARDAGTLIAGLFDRWRWDGGKALGERVARLEPFQEERLGTTVRLMREHGDVERWNLVLRFPTPPPPYEADARERALVARMTSDAGETEAGQP